MLCHDHESIVYPAFYRYNNMIHDSFFDLLDNPDLYFEYTFVLQKIYYSQDTSCNYTLIIKILINP